MKIPREAVLLRIFFGENDRFQRLPLHEATVLKAREMHLGGATVLRGHIGFGHSSRILSIQRRSCASRRICLSWLRSSTRKKKSTLSCLYSMA